MSLTETEIAVATCGWVACDVHRPPTGEVVMTMICDGDGCRNQQKMKLKNGLMVDIRSDALETVLR